MVLYVCERCGYETYQKCNYRSHLERKNPCKPTIKDVCISEMLEVLNRKVENIGHKCEHCDRVFKSAQSKYQHKKSCKEHDNNKRILELERQVEELKKTKSIINNNTTNIQNNIQINIKDFGNENISYLQKDFLTYCFANKDLYRLIENIHCDKEHPENHNIRVKSQKRKQIETRENEKWVIKDEDEALSDCIKNGYRVLLRHGWKHKNEIIEDELDNNVDEYHSINDWLESVYNNQDQQKPIKRKILLLLLSNQALLLGKDDE